MIWYFNVLSIFTPSLIQLSGFEDQKEKLNLKTYQYGVRRCYGKIEGHYPVCLPANHPFTRKLIIHEHTQMLHGGVKSTMSGIRCLWWIPKLRRLVKSLIHNCLGFNNYRSTPMFYYKGCIIRIVARLNS